MPKLLTDEQISNIKSAMDLLEKTSKENTELKSCISKRDNIILKLEEKIKELKQKEDFVEISNEE